MKGSVEILNTSRGTSEGVVIQPASVGDIPAGMTALFGLAGFTSTEVPLKEVERPRYEVTENEDGQRVRTLVIDSAMEPIADAVWSAKTPNGQDVQVLWREDRPFTLSEMAAAIDASMPEESEG